VDRLLTEITINAKLKMMLRQAAYGPVKSLTQQYVHKRPQREEQHSISTIGMATLIPLINPYESSPKMPCTFLDNENIWLLSENGHYF
jgi:hypothetical protein